jgi:hypothetical protein
VELARPDSTLLKVSADCEVYYQGSLTMYVPNYQFDSIIDGGSTLRQKRNYYFVFNSDSAFGNIYDPYGSHYLIGRRHIDTIKKRLVLQKSNLESLAFKHPDDTYYDADKNLIKVYTIFPTTEYPEKHTVYLSYSSKLNYISDTFSEKLDNVKGMKLFRIRLLAHGGYWEKFKMFMPKREAELQEMKEIELENKEEILSYFKKYRLHMKTKTN